MWNFQPSGWRGLGFLLRVPIERHVFDAQFAGILDESEVERVSETDK